MSKVVPLPPSHWCNTDRPTGATPLSHQCNTGSSNQKSYSLISSYKYPTGDPLEEITGEIEVETSASRACTRRKARFLKGPIPLDHIARAACLPGKALAVYLAIQHRSDLERRPSITLGAKLLSQFGVNRNAKARALQHLEQAGLVRIERKVGAAMRISLMVSNVAQPQPLYPKD